MPSHNALQELYCTYCSGYRQTPVDPPCAKPNHTSSQSLDPLLLVLQTKRCSSSPERQSAISPSLRNGPLKTLMFFGLGSKSASVSGLKTQSAIFKMERCQENLGNRRFKIKNNGAEKELFFILDIWTVSQITFLIRFIFQTPKQTFCQRTSESFF